MTNKTEFGLREAVSAFADEAEAMIKDKNTWSSSERQKARELRNTALRFLNECEEELWTWKATAKGGYGRSS